MQAKIFYAVTEATPSQIIATRSNPNLDNMGLQSWAGDRPIQKDVLAGKNYLDDAELRQLNRLTTILLDVLEDQLDIGRLTKMTEAAELLDGQLRGLNRPTLGRVGPPGAEKAKEIAKQNYKRFNQRRRELEAQKIHKNLVDLRSNEKSASKSKRNKRSSRRKP